MTRTSILAGWSAALVGLTAQHVLPPGDLRATVLDVGQGDAILLETPSRKRILVDTGDGGRVAAALGDVFGGSSPRRIDLLVITHPHDDHAGGVPTTLGGWSVGRVLLAGTSTGGSGWRRTVDALYHARVPVTFAAAGQGVSIDGVDLAVLWPLPGETGLLTDDPNDHSVVLHVRHGASAVLLTGDLERQGEVALLRSGAAVGATLLKVGHHGSATSTSPAFLSAVAPEAAVISVGARNPYRHPSPATLAGLEAHGVAVARTDLEGTITYRCSRCGCSRDAGWDDPWAVFSWSNTCDTMNR